MLLSKGGRPFLALCLVCLIVLCIAVDGKRKDKEKDKSKDSGEKDKSSSKEDKSSKEKSDKDDKNSKEKSDKDDKNSKEKSDKDDKNSKEKSDKDDTNSKEKSDKDDKNSKEKSDKDDKNSKEKSDKDDTNSKEKSDKDDKNSKEKSDKDDTNSKEKSDKDDKNSKEKSDKDDKNSKEKSDKDDKNSKEKSEDKNSKEKSDKDDKNSKEKSDKDDKNSKEKSDKDDKNSKEKSDKDDKDSNQGKDDNNGKSNSTTTVSSQCPDGKHVLRKGVCHYYNSTALGWEQTGAQCGLQKGLLVAPQSVGDGKQLFKDVRTNLQSGSSTYELWTGLYRDKSGTYYTSNGEDVNSGVKNQIKGEDSVQGTACVAADTTDDKSTTLKIKDCATALPFVCMVDTANDVWGRWATWEACSATCGNQASRKRQRTCFKASAGKNSTCQGNDTATQNCSLPACQDYQWGKWGEWSTCSVTCGKSERSRTRPCVDSVSKTENDTQCTGDRQETQRCNLTTCADYQWGQWGAWSTCSVTCGEGERSRTRPCVDSVSKTENDTQCTGDRQETQRCNLTTCADYQWGEWGEWSTCSVTCGEGERSRTRPCVDSVSKTENDTQCTGNRQETQRCNLTTCADYQWGQWGAWSTCSVTCGGGERSRTRPCVDSVSKTENDTQCTGDRQETQRCNLTTCADYQWGQWGAWSTCSVTCGEGERSRTRPCVDSVSKTENDTQCTGNRQETQRCNLTTCAAYQWQSWGSWNVCSLTCGEGQRSRGRRCVDKVSGQEVSEDMSSKCPGPKSQEEKCNQQKCPTYQWQSWGSWNVCSLTCGGGQRSRGRRCVDKVSGQEVSEDMSSKCPGPKSQEEKCNQQICPKPSWQTWEQWTACSKSCGVGVRSRVRTCALSGVSSNQCNGKESATRKCVMWCKDLSKEEMVNEIKSELNDSKTVERLEKWAQGTAHMTENLFSSELLTDYAISGHVIATHKVSSAMDCALKCLRAGCKSFNFRKDLDEKGLHECELNSVNREEALGDLVKRLGFVLYDYRCYVPFVDDLP